MLIGNGSTAPQHINQSETPALSSLGKRWARPAPLLAGLRCSLGVLPVQRGEAGALGLPRASLHGHRHPQRAAALRHLPAAQVASARPRHAHCYMALLHSKVSARHWIEWA